MPSAEVERSDPDRGNRQSHDSSAATNESPQQARFYETVLSTIADFAYVFDLDGRFRYANKALLDLWGLTLEEAVGRNFFDLHYPDDLAAKLQRQIQYVIETRQRVVDETPYISPAGVPGYYEYIFTPVLGKDGSVEVVAGSTRSITGRKQLEVEREQLLAELENQRSRLAAVVEHAPAFICTLRGPDHIYEIANDRYYEIVGKRPIIGKSVREALPELAGQGFFELLDHVYRTGESFSGNELPVRLQRERGESLDSRFINFVYQPMRDAAGAVSGIFVHGVDVTEMVRSREAIRASQQRLQTSEERLAFSVEAAELGTFFCPLPFGMIEWNAKCKEHFWLPPDANVDIDLFFAIIHPDDREPTRVALERSVSGHTPYDIEYRTISPEGRERWVRALGHAFYDDAGTPTRFDGVTLDITERKLADVRSKLFIALDDAMRALDDPREMVATCARLLGEHLRADRCAYADVEADEDTFNLTGDYNRGVPSMVGRYRFTDFGEEVLRLMRADKPYVVDDIEAHQPPVGDLTYYRQTMIRAVICVPLHKMGRFVGAMAVHQKVPRRWSPEEIDLVWGIANRCWESIERARVERTLRESETRFRTMADVMPQMIWVTRADGYHEYYNRRWYEFTGMPAGATDGVGWNEMFHPDDRERAWAVWRRSLETGETYEIEYRLRHHSGEYRWTLGRAVPVRNEHGEIERWFGTCTDIDALKRLTDERESVLASERAARTEAERAGRMKDEFLATLSHELRTPLNAIVGWAQILRNGKPTTADMTEGLTAIDRNARAQTQIIEDLLDMSRIVSGKIRLDVQRIDLAAVVQAAVDTMRPAADAKGIRIDALIDPRVGQVGGDPGRMHQVFWNLLSNSIKFTPRGGRVRVVLERVESHLDVSVIDTGEGIRAEFLPHVFDRFRQADASTTRRHGGLGLGLSIVKQLVELHGGTVRVHSAGAAMGTTFTVSLPLMALRQSAEPHSNGVEPRAVAAGLPAELYLDACEQLKGIKVVVVDDEPDARAVVQRLLEDCKAFVIAAANAAEAVALIESERPDVLISDIGMPGEDGYSLIRRVRALGAAKGGDVPALALTAYARAEDRVRAVRAGFQTHVVKPVEPAELITMVASLAGRTNQ